MDLSHERSGDMRSWKRGAWCLLMILLVCGVFQGTPRAEETGLDPGTGQGEGFNPGLWLLSIFRDHLSAVDSDRCPSFPSCSSYGVQAMRKHGFFTGWVMTVDRLIHEGREEARVSPRVYSDGRWKIYDPVENNDFWWYRPDRKARE